MPRNSGPSTAVLGIMVQWQGRQAYAENREALEGQKEPFKPVGRPW